MTPRGVRKHHDRGENAPRLWWMVNRKKPWVIVMANFLPEKRALSEDRWMIKNVDIKKSEDVWKKPWEF